ncbi:MAG: hypothetical protein K0A94_01815 [Desulfuromonadales bacterium]|nr:hypothetical protein [Desulfuromonadales bacterium]
MLKTQREKVARGNDHCGDMDVLVERGRQLHSAAIADAVINLFSGALTRQDQRKKGPGTLHHAPGHQAH